MWDCAEAALPARSKSWEEVLKNDLGGRAPWAGSVPIFVLLPRISTQICVMQIRPQILPSVTFMTAEFPLVFNVIAFSVFVVSEEHVIGACITSDSGPKPARTQIS